MVTVQLPVAGVFCVALPLTAQSQVSCLLVFAVLLHPQLHNPTMKWTSPRGQMDKQGLRAIF